MSIGRLLLAEDDEEMRSLLGSTLRGDGYDIVEAADGAEMLECITAAESSGQTMDLVVADIRMPGLTGLQVLERIRQPDFDTPVILITAFGDRATHDKAYALGAAAILDKPFELDDLRSVVLYFKRRHDAQHEAPPHS